MSRKKVAVIGAGGTGLVCARECLREGHEVIVFEKENVSGGTWVLDQLPPEVQMMDIYQDGYDEVARKHTITMYEDLRLNSPRHIMGVTDYPFDSKFPGSKDPRSFPDREEIVRYVNAFKNHYDLDKHVIYDAEVVLVKPINVGSSFKWKVKVQFKEDIKEYQFDAVAVAIGHYCIPDIPKIKNIEKFEKPCLHSHLYRTPKLYKDKTVLILGRGFSALDISQDLSKYAKKVYVCARNWSPHHYTSEPIGSKKNVYLLANISHCVSKGAVQLDDGTILDGLDCLLLCTGFHYDFPFLEPKDMVATANRHVHPVYKQLSNLATKTIEDEYNCAELQRIDIPLLCAEFQSVYFARILAGKCTLPTEEEMMEDIRLTYKDLEKRNIDIRHYHSMEHNQFVYLEDLRKLSGYDRKLAKWREESYSYLKTVLIRDRLFTYRNEPFPQHLLDQADAEFAEVRQKSYQV